MEQEGEEILLLYTHMFPLTLKSKRHILCTGVLSSDTSQLFLFSYITKMSHKCIESDRYCMALKLLEQDTQG